MKQINLKQNISLTFEDNLQDSMKQRKNILKISNQTEIYYLNSDLILYVEADGNYCDIHLTDGDVLKTVGAGVTVSNIVPSDQIQGSLFGYDEDLRQKHDRLSELMDSVNSTSLLDLTEKHQLHYHWVKGHADNPKNNRCDQLAVAESKKFQ